ncbi:MAG: efflux RND transporter permease subunit [Sporocytophaga sp.]|nr:efflux RND transporter permease subunit [Sporocytophaga sp.]
MKKLFKKLFKRNTDPLTAEERLEVISYSSKQVGPGVFFSTIVVIASFLPVFLLTGMEGKLFHPLAWTKTFILLVDAFLAISLTPVLISFFSKRSIKTGRSKSNNQDLGENLYTCFNMVLTLEKNSYCN